MNTRVKRSMVAAAFAALLLTACQSSAPAEMKEVATQNAGGLKIVLMSESGELTQGQNQFQMKFEDAGGQPVDAGTVTVSSSMSMPGMAPMVAPMELTNTGTGEYAMHGTFGMSGAWMFEVRWDGPAGQGSTSFNTSVR